MLARARPLNHRLRFSDVLIAEFYFLVSRFHIQNACFKSVYLQVYLRVDIVLYKVTYKTTLSFYVNIVNSAFLFLVRRTLFIIYICTKYQFSVAKVAKIVRFPNKGCLKYSYAIQFSIQIKCRHNAIYLAKDLRYITRQRLTQNKNKQTLPCPSFLYIYSNSLSFKW